MNVFVAKTHKTCHMSNVAKPLCQFQNKGITSSRGEIVEYYHGSSSAAMRREEFRLLPPVNSGRQQEESRKKNLDRVFFTRDIKLARIYAGRACNVFGGSPVVFRVVVAEDAVVCLSDTPGATVYHAPGAFVELIEG